MDLLIHILGELSLDDFIRGLVHWTPLWSLVFFLFIKLWQKIEASRREEEARLVRIETKIDLQFKIADQNRHDIEEIKQIQKTQEVELRSLWEIIKTKKLKIHDLTS